MLLRHLSLDLTLPLSVQLLGERACPKTRLTKGEREKEESKRDPHLVSMNEWE